MAYRFTRDRGLEIPVLDRVPRREGFGPRVLAALGRAKLELAQNRAGQAWARAWGSDLGGGGGPRERAARSLFVTIERPLSLTHASRGPDSHDRRFAWQRLAGPNPLNLRRLDRVPARFPVPAALFRRVLADGDTLAAAAGEGRLFLGDWSVLASLSAGSWDGARKHLPAPLALFVTRRRSGAAPEGGLYPVAIQCGPTPSADAPIVCPLDGERWRMARTAVQVADLNAYELELHLGRCHFLVERVAVAMHRQLAPRHPLRVLLAPHFEHTLAINAATRRDILRPGDDVECLLAGTLAASRALIRRGADNLELDALAFDSDLRRRGLDARDGLPVYPWRDDGEPVWDAIREWVRAYLQRYYPDEVYRTGDHELRGFLAALTDPAEAGLRGLDPVDSVAALERLVSALVFTCSALHAAINYSQYAFAGYPPNMPCAAFAPVPATAGAPGPGWDDMLMPPALTTRQFEFFYVQSSVRLNRLGDYPRAGFADDERVAAALRRFRERLRGIDERTRARDRARLMPYPWLRPALITASVHI